MRHIVVDNDTRLVTHILMWNNDLILPPPNTLMFSDAIACIGDWWCEDNDRFYTPNKKRRIVIENRLAEVELSEDEKRFLGSKLDAIFNSKEDDKHL
jgi:hypothetical protein